MGAHRGRGGYGAENLDVSGRLCSPNGRWSSSGRYGVCYLRRFSQFYSRLFDVNHLCRMTRSLAFSRHPPPHPGLSPDRPTPSRWVSNVSSHTSLGLPLLNRIRFRFSTRSAIPRPACPRSGTGALLRGVHLPPDQGVLPAAGRQGYAGGFSETGAANRRNYPHRP